jgi:hypothetical protein
MGCRLCLKNVKLVNSHVISEFLYSRMYDPKHRFFVISSAPEVDDRLFQKGLREPLLCEDCDNRVLSTYENYARRVLDGGEMIQTAIDRNDLRLRDLDYTRLRMFYLSLLWRMSVSKHPYFKEVSLGPHEEVLRRMLLEARPGEPDQYGLLCVAPVFGGQHLGNWMMPPDWVRMNGRRVYRCLIAGLLYCFFVGESPLPGHLMERFIQKNGSWVIRREKIEKIRFLADWCVRIGEAMNERRLRGGARV